MQFDQLNRREFTFGALSADCRDIGLRKSVSGIRHFETDQMQAQSGDKQT